MPARSVKAACGDAAGICQPWIPQFRFLTSELLTWGAGNLSAFWAFARGCDRVMHLQFRAGELGVSLVQVRAKRFEDSNETHTKFPGTELEMHYAVATARE